MRPYRYSLSLEAQRDLAEIYNYLADKGDAATGRRLVERLQQKIQALAAVRNAGVARDWISPGLRAFPYKNRCIYFRVLDDRIHVLRILHGRQDSGPRVFMPDEET